MAYEYIQRAYGLTFKPGLQVRHTVTGRRGTVRREDPSAGHYVQVLFFNDRHPLPCHPEELVPIHVEA